MVLTLAIPAAQDLRLEDFITMRHLRQHGQVMLATGLIVAYGYIMEAFMAWYSGNPFEQYMMINRMFGPYACVYWVADALQRAGAASAVVSRACAPACRCCS